MCSTSLSKEDNDAIVHWTTSESMMNRRPIGTLVITRCIDDHCIVCSIDANLVKVRLSLTNPFAIVYEFLKDYLNESLACSRPIWGDGKILIL